MQNIYYHIMENIIILAIAGIGSLIGSSLSSYFIEKTKNLATKEDTEEITNKIENVKNHYGLLLENHRNEIRKMYDISKPSLELTIRIDKGLINKVHDLNISVFEYQNYEQGHEKAAQIISQIGILTKHIIAYYSRYKNLIGVKEILEVNNGFAKLQGNEVYQNDIDPMLNKLSYNLDLLLSYFLVPLYNK